MISDLQIFKSRKALIVGFLKNGTNLVESTFSFTQWFTYIRAVGSLEVQNNPKIFACCVQLMCAWIYLKAISSGSDSVTLQITWW